jgi:aspartate/methionine/tyrosine aminotransferase
LASLPGGATVVYLGTFSKIFCPGMRVGWLAAPRELYEKYALVKQGADLHTSTLAQYQILAYLERFDLDASIARIRGVRDRPARSRLRGSLLRCDRVCQGRHRGGRRRRRAGRDQPEEPPPRALHEVAHQNTFIG